MKIRQSSSFLFTLIREVSAGRMLPAAMQRPYVWRKADVEALCDSILSGFPIGAFLMWAPGEKADLTCLAKGRLGPMLPAKDVETSNPYCLLLDGQNRLATLAWMMAQEFTDLPDASEAERETWMGDERLVLDYVAQSVKFVPAEQAGLGLRLPAWTLVSSATDVTYSSAMQLIRSLWLTEWSASFSDAEIQEFIKLWDRCCDRFREARTTETVIENATADEARHAFLRICRVGIPMAQEDFDRAIGWLPSEGKAKHDSANQGNAGNALIKDALAAK